MKGCEVNKLSLPFLTRKSMDAFGKCECSFSATDVARITSPKKAVCIIRIFNLKKY